MLRTLVTLAVLACLSTARAQEFRITEVLPNPVAGDQIVEVTNIGGATANLGGMNLCVQNIYHALPSVSLAPGASVRVHMSAAGVNTPTDIFTGLSFPSLGFLIQSVSLYKPGAGFIFFGNPANIVDFLQYGAGGQLRSEVAVAAGIWPSIDEFVPSPSAAVSLAWDGGGETAANWFRDTSPTLGAPNLTATSAVASVGSGCGAVAPPTLSNSSVPAFGNLDLALLVGSSQPNKPALLFVGLGTTSVPVLQVCSFHVNSVPFLLEIPLATDAAGGIVLPVFVEIPSLAGIELGFQVLIQGSVPVPKFDMTNGLGLTF